MTQAENLSQAFELGFYLHLLTGPVVGRFLSALRERRIFGIRASDGRVIVPRRSTTRIPRRRWTNLSRWGSAAVSSAGAG